MSNDNEASIRITGDATGVGPAVDEAKSDVMGLRDAIAGMAGTMQATTAQMVASMAGLREALEATKRELHEDEGEGGFLSGIAKHIEEGMAPISKLRAGLGEIGEAIMVAFAVEMISEWAEHVGEAAEKIQHLAETLGQTPNQIRELQVVAQQTGISFDTVSRGMMLMNRNLAQSAGAATPMARAFKEMGISIDDGRTQIERLGEASEYISKVGDAGKRTALEMEVFGRAGAALNPLLMKGKEGLAELIAEQQKYGASSTDISDQSQAAGMMIAESVNTSKVAWDGLQNMIIGSLGPAVSGMIDGFSNLVAEMVASYEEGGTVKTVFEVIGAAATIAGNIFSVLGSVIGDLWDIAGTVFSAIMELVATCLGTSVPENVGSTQRVINQLVDVVRVLGDMFSIVMHEISEYVQIAAVELTTFGRIADDALSMDWGKIEGDWQGGMGRITNIVTASIDKIRAAADDAKKAIIAGAQGLTVHPEHDDKNGAAGEGGGDNDPQFGKQAKAKKPKGGADQMAIWKDELDQKKILWENSGADIARNEEAFWAQIVATTKAGSKEQLAAKSEESRAHQAVIKEDLANETAAIKTSETIAIDKAKTDEQLASMALPAKLKALDAELKAGQITNAQYTADRKKMTDDLYALEETEANKEYQIKLAAINSELGLANQTEAQTRTLLNEKAILEQQHADQMVLINQKMNDAKAAEDEKAIEKQRAQWQKVFQPFSDNLGKMLTLQESWQKGITNIYDSMVRNIGTAISKMVEQWLVGLLVKDAASEKNNAKEMFRTAGQAAAHAFSAVAAIPIIGPILAPAAAAAAFAGVMAFSAQDGMGEVPYDNAPFLLHAKEMVLPAELATGVRNMISAGGAGSTSYSAPSRPGNANTPMAANDAGTGSGGGSSASDFHYHDHSGTMTPDQIHANRGAIAKAVKSAHKEGHFTNFKFGGK